MRAHSVSKFGDLLPDWAIYIISSLGSLILITLHNIQAQIEYPFDQQGAYDIKLEDFNLNI